MSAGTKTCCGRFPEGDYAGTQGGHWKGERHLSCCLAPRRGTLQAAQHEEAMGSPLLRTGAGWSCERTHQVLFPFVYQEVIDKASANLDHFVFERDVPIEIEEKKSTDSRVWKSLYGREPIILRVLA